MERRWAITEFTKKLKSSYPPEGQELLPYFSCLLVRLKCGSCVLITLSLLQGSCADSWGYFGIGVCSSIMRVCPCLEFPDACQPVPLWDQSRSPGHFPWPSPNQGSGCDAASSTDHGASACGLSAGSTETPRASSAPIFTQHCAKEAHWNHLLAVEFFFLNHNWTWLWVVCTLNLLKWVEVGTTAEWRKLFWDEQANWGPGD